MKEIIVGIDLGTTNSAIAYVKDGVAEMIPVDGQPTMPSCVGIDPEGLDLRQGGRTARLGFAKIGERSR